MAQLSPGHFYREWRWWDLVTFAESGENLHRNLVAIQIGEWNRELPTDWLYTAVHCGTYSKY